MATLHSLLEQVIQLKKDGLDNNAIAEQLKPIFEKQIPDEYKKYIEDYTSEEIVDFGSTYDSLLGGENKQDFIDILTLIRGK